MLAERPGEALTFAMRLVQSRQGGGWLRAPHRAGN